MEASELKMLADIALGAATGVAILIIVLLGFLSWCDDRAERSSPPRDRIRRVLKPWKR